MKKSLAILTVVSLLFSGALFASFPVENAKESQATTIEVKNADQTTVEALNSSEIKNLDVKKSDLKKEITKKSKSDDEFIITLLLCLLAGGLAAHRWYQKKPIGWNILFILTFGGCGVWWLIDLINILRKDF